MGKKILILSGSPWKGANSETLCAQFAKGGSEAGHTVELIRLQEKKLNFCTACYACKKTGVCVQKDDMAEILEKMGAADVIVLSTPVYFYHRVVDRVNFLLTNYEQVCVCTIRNA